MDIMHRQKLSVARLTSGIRLGNRGTLPRIGGVRQHLEIDIAVK
jgi:hypothetical protein